MNAWGVGTASDHVSAGEEGPGVWSSIRSGVRFRFILVNRGQKERIRVQIAMTRSGEKIFETAIARVTLLTTRLYNNEFLATAVGLER